MDTEFTCRAIRFRIQVIFKQCADIPLLRACAAASEMTLLCCDGDNRLQVSSRNIVHDSRNLTGFQLSKALQLQGIIEHARRQLEQVTRRLINEEKIPHEEKVFSIFEPQPAGL